MANLAEIVDVESNWRPLRGQESVLAETLLTTASAALRIRLPGLDARIIADPTLADLVRGVVAQAVVRVLRGGDRTDPSLETGIYFTNAEINALEVGGGSEAFTITPGGAAPGTRYGWDDFSWGPV